MAHDDTLAKALTNVRHQREILQAEYERVGDELTKLRLAERSLAAIVEGASMDDLMAEPTSRRRASTGEDQPRAGRGPRGPRANSAKGRLKTLLEEAGPEGLTHAEITERLTGVAANTLATYLSMMSSSGELERHGDKYHAGTAAASDASNEDMAEAEAEEDGEQAQAAE